MDSGKTDNERELTSTMGNVLSVSIKDEKNDTSGSDATPTSSTDANTSTTSSQIVSDDPISSTSSDVVELNKSKSLETVTQSSVEVSQTVMDEPDKTSVDPETDLLEMSISSVSREKITEDVEDLVHDLESLLGESTDSFNIVVRRREDQKPPVEKEPAKSPQKPFESGDTLSLEDGPSEKNIKIIESNDTEQDITENVSSHSVTEGQTDVTQGSGVQETESSSTDVAKDKKTINEDTSLCENEELPISTSLESETIVQCANVIKSPQAYQPDTVIDEIAAVVESENIEKSTTDDTELVTTEQECSEHITDEERVEDNQTKIGLNTEQIVDINDGNRELEGPAEPIEEKTVTDEVENITNEVSDELQGPIEETVMEEVADVTNEISNEPQGPIEETVTEDVEDVTKEISDQPQGPIEETVMEEVADVTNEVSNEPQGPIEERVTEDVEDITNEVRDQPQELIEETVMEEVADVTNEVSNEPQGPIEETVTEDVKDITIQVSDQPQGPIEETVTEEMEGIANEVSDQPQGPIEETVMEEVQDITTEVSDQPQGQIGETVTEEVYDITNEINDQPQGPIKEKVMEGVEDITNEVSDQLQSSIEETVTEEVEDITIEVGDQPQSPIEETVMKEVKDVTNEVSDQLQGPIEETVREEEEDITYEVRDQSQGPIEEAVTKEVEDITNEVSDQLQGSKEIEISDTVTEHAEVESSALKSDVSFPDVNIEEDRFERTEKADTVDQTESISRDTKTELVESVDSECKEVHSSQQKDPDSPVIQSPSVEHLSEEIVPEEDKNDNLEAEVIREIKEVEDVSPEVHDEPMVTENKLEENCSDSESPDPNQTKVYEQGTADTPVEVVLPHETEIATTCDKDTLKSVPIDLEVVATCQDDTLKSVPVDSDGNTEKSAEIELHKVEESSSTIDLKSQTDIPKLDTKSDPEYCIEYVESIEIEEVIEASTKDASPVSLEESNFNQNEPIIEEAPTEVEVPTPTHDFIITEEISAIVDEDDITESHQEEIPQTEPIIEEIDDAKTVDTEIETVIEEPTIVEISDEVPPPSSFSTDIDTRQGSSCEEVKDNFVEQMDELLSDTAAKETIEAEIAALTESVDEKREDQKLVPDVAENEASEAQKLTETDKIDDAVVEVTEDLVKTCEDISSPQEVVFDSETIITEDISVIKSDDIPEEKQTKESDEPAVVAENADTECEEITETVEEICEFSVGISNYIDPELDSEVIKSSPVDEESSKTDNSQQEEDPIVLEEALAEEDKQSRDFDWVEDAVSEEPEAAGDVVVIQDDEIEDTDKEEILDDDSKIIQVENVPFFLSVGDSDSEDTVPTLVLEPDEVNPSPELLSSEKEPDQIEESLTVHSTNDSEIPDGLPEIEDILNDQGTVDEVVENIDMQENLETILAVASLQSTEEVEVVESLLEPQISDKERREMEALRMAVESITETPSIDYGQVEDITELVENVEDQSQQQIIPEVKTINSDLNVEPQKSRTEETELILEVKSVDSTVEIPVSKTEFNNDIKIEENHVIQESTVTIAEETVQTLPDTSEDKVEASREEQDATTVLPDSSQNISVGEETKSTETFREKEGRAKVNERPKRHKKSSTDNKFEELSINVDVPEREKPYSPKVTIKPIKVPDEEVSTTSNSDSEIGKGSLKMTITKQSDTMHSVLKICESDNSESLQEQDEPIPKLIIKPKMQQVEQQHSPKMSTRSSKQMYSPTSSTQRSGSPRITIKPVIKPDKECHTPLKIKIKPEEGSKKHSPKLSIKPIPKSEEECRENIQSPRKVVIKPVVKPVDDIEQVPSPRITIKPIPKPESEKESISVTPRLSIKPIKKQDEDDVDTERERSSPKIIIKPLVKPQEPDTQAVDAEESVKERIVLKINKGNLPTPTKESKKREHPPDDEKSEKLAKITVKFSKGGGHAHIVQQSEESNKRGHEEPPTPEKTKKLKTENESPVLTRSKHKDVLVEHVTGDLPKNKQREIELHVVETRSKHTHSMNEAPIEAKRVKLKDTPETSHVKQREIINESSRSRANNDSSDEIRIIENKLDSPIVISEDSRSQDSGSCIIVEDVKDPLDNVPMYELPVKAAPETPPVVTIKQDVVSTTPTTPTPRKRGRPRKVPIVVREEFKEQEEPKPEPKKEEPLVHDSGRPKRSCRGQSVRATLGIKPRKPRGPGRGRGSKRGMGTRVVPMKPEQAPKLSKAKLKLIQESLKVELLRADEIVEREPKPCELPQVVEEDIKPPAPVVVEPAELVCPLPTLIPEPSPQGPIDTAPLLSTSPKPASSLLTTEIADSTGVPPATPSTSRAESAEIVMVDEETRMSADTNSRAQTPAKQVVPSDVVVIEESQSSVQSTATTESGKVASSRPNKAPRLEVQEPEGAVISADQLTEYYWNGNGPFMLQEQVAQFLGIKSFKRKYPGIMRRMLEMQERDFIRESGLASEHMCDLGLTAVNSADILDIMYSDFQEKYEEYCKHQRDRQAKELINKQKALSLAASQEKNKADITEQAVQSAAQWNTSFNRTRKEQRKACMDLQTLTVHYPKGKMKQINKPKVGNYPVALVPGQFTDYYKEFTPTEINNLPLNTLCYNEINIIRPEESEDSGSEGSDSDSESSSSSSDSGSSSSGVEDCKLCKHTPKKGLSSK